MNCSNEHPSPRSSSSNGRILSRGVGSALIAHHRLEVYPAECGTPIDNVKTWVIGYYSSLNENEFMREYRHIFDNPALHGYAWVTRYIPYYWIRKSRHTWIWLCGQHDIPNTKCKIFSSQVLVALAHPRSPNAAHQFSSVLEGLKMCIGKQWTNCCDTGVQHKYIWL